jgi:hypothetical protein
MVGALFLWALMGGSAARAAELGDEGILEKLLALNLERAARQLQTR